MATTIKLKNGSGAPLAGDLVQGEPALDLTNKRLYTEDAGGNVIEIGTSPSTIDINAGTIDGTVIGGASAAAGTFTTLTATGNVVLGDAATDTVTVTADVASDLIPSADGTYDLGASGSEWQDLFIDGTANIDSLVADTADINGGTIDGTVIGGASAAAGTFTTLTTSSTVTHNGGTANGVAYLNGSKVLTTGGALTFDGTNLLQVSSAAGKLRLGVNTSDQFLDIYRDNGSGASVYNAAQGSGFGFHVWQVAGSEQMRLTSTGLGIGTSSPGAKFHVLSGSDEPLIWGSTNATYNYATIRHHSSGDIAYYGACGGAAMTAGSSSDFGLRANQGAMLFATNGNNERMRLDASGNLGLGVTPSAWGSTFKALQIGGNGVSLWTQGSTAGALYLSNNTYYDGASRRYIATASASEYQQAGGSHQWFTAASGTAGNAITFTQAMTLDASGNLIVGDTTSTGRFKAVVANDATLQLAGSFTNNTNADFNINIKTSETWIGPSTSTPLIFANSGNTERLRIDSSGNLLVGTTTTRPNSVTFDGRVTAASTTSISAFHGASNSTSATTQIAFSNPNGAVGTITTSASATAYNTSSDYRLKNITGPITTSGAYIDSLNPVEGTWKADGSTFVGLIAHEVQEVSRTQVATGEKDGEEMQGMDYSSAEIIANLIAEVKALRQRVYALENQ